MRDSGHAEVRRYWKDRIYRFLDKAGRQAAQIVGDDEANRLLGRVYRHGGH